MRKMKNISQIMLDYSCVWENNPNYGNYKQNTDNSHQPDPATTGTHSIEKRHLLRKF